MIFQHIDTCDHGVYAELSLDLRLTSSDIGGDSRSSDLVVLVRRLFSGPAELNPEPRVL